MVRSFYDSVLAQIDQEAKKIGLNPAGEKSAVFVLGDESTVLVGAGNDAIPAADTFILVDHYNTILTPIGCAGRADFNARGVVAMITPYGVGRYYRSVQACFQRYKSWPGNA